MKIQISLVYPQQKVLSESKELPSDMK